MQGSNLATIVVVGGVAALLYFNRDKLASMFGLGEAGALPSGGSGSGYSNVTTPETTQTYSVPNNEVGNNANVQTNKEVLAQPYNPLSEQAKAINSEVSFRLQGTPILQSFSDKSLRYNTPFGEFAYYPEKDSGMFTQKTDLLTQGFAEGIVQNKFYPYQSTSNGQMYTNPQGTVSFEVKRDPYQKGVFGDFERKLETISGKKITPITNLKVYSNKSTQNMSVGKVGLSSAVATGVEVGSSLETIKGTGSLVGGVRGVFGIPIYSSVIKSMPKVVQTSNEQIYSKPKVSSGSSNIGSKITLSPKANVEVKKASTGVSLKPTLKQATANIFKGSSSKFKL